MYDVMIRLNEIITTFSIEELKEVKKILKQFKQVDEFKLVYVDEDEKQKKKVKWNKIFGLTKIINNTASY